MKVYINLQKQKTAFLIYFELFPLERFPFNLNTLPPLNIPIFFFLTEIEIFLKSKNIFCLNF